MQWTARWSVGACLLAGCASTPHGALPIGAGAPNGVVEYHAARPAEGRPGAPTERDVASAPESATSRDEASVRDEPATDAKKRIGTCKLTATLRDAGPDETSARFTLRLTNTGSTALRLVLPGDGSEVGWRTPVLTWRATSGGRPAAAGPLARCGLMNPITPDEIVTLAPGASRDIADWILPPSLPPGSYDLRLTYRNDPRLLGRTRSTPEVERLVAESSACEVTSNALSVSWR